MTNDKTVSEIIGETAANRDRAIAEAEAKRRAMWARIPRLAELDGVLSRTGSRIMAAAAAGGRIIVPKQANNGVTAAVARKDML